MMYPTEKNIIGLPSVTRDMINGRKGILLLHKPSKPEQLASLWDITLRNVDSEYIERGKTYQGQ